MLYKIFVKKIRISSISSLYFPALGQNMEIHRVNLTYLVRMRNNTDQKNSENGPFSWSEERAFVGNGSKIVPFFVKVFLK